jgi:hypothetical protein
LGAVLGTPELFGVVRPESGVAVSHATLALVGGEGGGGGGAGGVGGVVRARGVCMARLPGAPL